MRYFLLRYSARILVMLECQNGETESDGARKTHFREFAFPSFCIKSAASRVESGKMLLIILGFSGNSTTHEIN